MNLELKEENKGTTIGDKDHCHNKTGNLKKDPTVKKENFSREYCFLTP